MTSRNFSQVNKNLPDNISSEEVSKNENMSIEIDEEAAMKEISSNKNIFAAFKSQKIQNINSNFPQSQSKIYSTRKLPTTNFHLLSNDIEDNFSCKTSHIEIFTSKKRTLPKKSPEKKNKIKKTEITTTENILNNLITCFTKYEYNTNDIKHYFDDNHLKLTQKNQPYIELKVLCTSENVDLRCVANSYIIGENGLDSSMKNHNRDVTTIGRQQINNEMIRPNDIMLFPTDSSLSRCHLTIHHKNFFDEIKKYKSDVNSVIKISLKSKYSHIPQQIWYGIIHFLKPRLKLEIQDQGTIYGSYVKIDEMSVFNLIMNLYILLCDSKENLFYFFKSDLLYISNLKRTNNNNINIVNNNHLEHFINGNLDQINSMNIKQVLQKLYQILMKSGVSTVCENLKQYLNYNLNNILLNPYGQNFNYETLFNRTNNILHHKQFYLTSNRSGFIVDIIAPLGRTLEKLFIEYIMPHNFTYQGNDGRSHLINFSLLSIGKIHKNQKMEPNSKIHFINYNSINEIPNLNEFSAGFLCHSIMLIETEGDPCGQMNHIKIIILVDTLFDYDDNRNVFSIAFQRGFVFGKNKFACCCSPYMDCNFFIYYSIQAKCWAINEISNLVGGDNNSNNNNFVNGQYFGLYICISEDKGGDDRFKQKKYCVQQGDKIKLSDTVLEVRFHI